MDIKEVFENCSQGDRLIDNYGREWMVGYSTLTNSDIKIGHCYTLRSLVTELSFELAKDNVDWNKVEVDTKILVSSNNRTWYKRYFAKYENDKVCTFVDGATSFSTDGYYISWKYAKLYKEDGEEEENGN